MSSLSGNKSLAKTGKKKMRLSRRNSIANVTSNKNTLRLKKTKPRSKTEEYLDTLARRVEKLNRERDALFDKYQDGLANGLEAKLLRQLKSDLEDKFRELETVRDEINRSEFTKDLLPPYMTTVEKLNQELINNPKSYINKTELEANKKAAKLHKTDKRLPDEDASVLLATNEIDFDAKVEEFKEKYKTDEAFAKDINRLRAALANGDWVFMNDKHKDTTAFALARLLMEGAKPGKVLLEQPYSLNWDDNMLTGMISYGAGRGKVVGPWPAVLSKSAIANGWLPVPADGVSKNQDLVEKDAIKASGVTGHDNDKMLSKGGHGNWVRQNYIARNLFHEMENSANGGIIIFGTEHIRGKKSTGETALQDIVSTQSFEQSEKIKLAKGDSTSDYFATIVPKKALNPDKPNYSSGPKKKKPRQIKRTTNLKPAQIERIKFKASKANANLQSIADQYKTTLQKVEELKKEVDARKQALDEIKTKLMTEQDVADLVAEHKVTKVELDHIRREIKRQSASDV